MGTRPNGAALYLQYRRAKAKAFTLLIAGGFAEWGARSVAVPPLRFSGQNRVHVGRDVYFGEGCWLQVTSHNNALGELWIGDACSFAGGCVVSAAANVRIGNGVLFARNVYVADHDHAFADVTRPVLEQGVQSVAPVVIDDGAWLGQNAVVTSGVRVGRGAVVGANSVVLSDVPDFSLAVGAPARVIKTWGGPA